MTLLEARDLRKTYRLSRDNVVEALRGVDVTIETGEMVAIMGPSGSGKSTLMHILGLLHAPDASGGAGPVLRFGGRDVRGLSDSARTRLRAREMGFVFQSFNLVPTLSALENVALAAEYAGQGGAAARSAAEASLALVGLTSRAGHRPSELSGGEQQRVAIARALVTRPALVLCDEPTGNLDSARSAEVLAVLRTLNREHGQTFVIVTHDPEVGAACDRVIRMRDGRVQDDGRGGPATTTESRGSGRPATLVPGDVGRERPERSVARRLAGTLSALALAMAVAACGGTGGPEPESSATIAPGSTGPSATDSVSSTSEPGGHGIGTIWSGEFTSSWSDDGVIVTMTARALFERQEGTDPGATYATYEMLGGTMEWSRAGTTAKGCTESGGPVSVPIPAGTDGAIRFDTSEGPGVIAYDGSASVSGGPSVTVQVTCPTRSSEYSTKAQGQFFLAPESQGFLLTGDGAQGTYITSGQIPVTFTWTISKVE
jgi:putative ABC transport system ATP-binding protein